MGWLFTQGQTRKELIEDLTRTQENEHAKFVTLRRFCSGNTLWTVQEVTRKATNETTRFIGCYLMQRQHNYGWGYMDMDESCGPCEVTCPLGFFDMVPDPGGYATAWRERVRMYHARVHQKIVKGQLIALTNGKLYEVLSVRPLRAVGADGVTYRIPRRMLAPIVKEA